MTLTSVGSSGFCDAKARATKEAKNDQAEAQVSRSPRVAFTCPPPTMKLAAHLCLGDD